jgi:hypothetical protein
LAREAIFYQPATIASVGQVDAQLPQSMHLSGSIQRASFFSLMAVTGHSPSQAPQLMQASVILYAMAVLLELYALRLYYHSSRFL